MRDKYLTEAMGECWHIFKLIPYVGHQCINFAPIKCEKCGVKTISENENDKFIDFSTWEGFGKLWEWAQQQEWWKEFSYQDSVRYKMAKYDPYNIINPDRFSDALYTYLKERDDGEC